MCFLTPLLFIHLFIEWFIHFKSFFLFFEFISTLLHKFRHLYLSGHDEDSREVYCLLRKIKTQLNDRQRIMSCSVTASLVPAWTKIAPVVSRTGQRLVLQRILYMSRRYCIRLADTVYILQILYTSCRYCICLAKGEDLYSVCIRL